MLHRPSADNKCVLGLLNRKGNADKLITSVITMANDEYPLEMSRRGEGLAYKNEGAKIYV